MDHTAKMRNHLILPSWYVRIFMGIRWRISVINKPDWHDMMCFRENGSETDHGEINLFSHCRRLFNKSHHFEKRTWMCYVCRSEPRNHFDHSVFENNEKSENNAMFHIDETRKWFVHLLNRRLEGGCDLFPWRGWDWWLCGYGLLLLVVVLVVVVGFNNPSQL